MWHIIKYHVDRTEHSFKQYKYQQLVQIQYQNKYKHIAIAAIFNLNKWQSFNAGKILL